MQDLFHVFYLYFIFEIKNCRSIKTKGKQRLLPKGGGWGLFGYHTINSDTTEILITEGEFDTLAAAEVFVI